MSGNRSALNTLFLAAGAGGFVLIYGAGAETADLLAPTFVVVGYAVLVRLGTKYMSDQPLAEHHIDSIYFLGFLFTLFSLIALFASLQENGIDAAGDIGFAFTYIGISVATSIAGILFRSIVRGAWLKDHPEQTVDSIEAFLAERASTVNALAAKEQAYLAALSSFVDATDSFSQDLGRARAALVPEVDALAEAMSRQNGQVERVTQLATSFTDVSDDMHRRAQSLPFNTIAGEMSRFNTGVSELNTALDSLITLLERKVERVS